MQNFNYHTHTYRCGHADNNMSDEEAHQYIKVLEAIIQNKRNASNSKKGDE